MGLIRKLVRKWTPYSSSEPGWDHRATRRRRERREERTQIGHASRRDDDDDNEGSEG